MNGRPTSELYIAISGMIGAGKTLATELGKVMKLPVYYEKVIDNVYLADFYKNPKEFGFPLQIYLLNNRFEQQQQVIWQGKGGIQDRSIYEDLVFCTMLKNDNLIDQRNFNTYKRLFDNMSNFMKRPNLIVHLDVTPEESFRRMKMRSRDCENTVSLEYLSSLHKHYEIFIEWISKEIPVIKVDYNRFKTSENMARIIKEEWEKMTTVREVLHCIPVLKNPIQNQLVYINESFSMDLSVDIFQSDLFSPVTYKINSVGHDWLIETSKTPRIISRLFDADGVAEMLYLDKEKNILYAIDIEYVRMLNVSNPSNPILLSKFKDDDLDDAVYGKDGHVYVAKTTGVIQKYDFTDYDNPSKGASIALFGVTAIDIYKNVLYAISQNRLYSIDMNTMIEISNILLPSGSDGSIQMYVGGDLIYLGGMYSETLAEINITDPTNMFTQDSLDLTSFDDSITRLRVIVRVNDMIYLTKSLSTTEYQFKSLNISNGLSSVTNYSNSYSMPVSTYRITCLEAVSNNYAYICGYNAPNNFIRVLDLSTYIPTIVGDLETDSTYPKVKAANNDSTLFVADMGYGFIIYDFTNKSEFREIGWVETSFISNQYNVQIAKKNKMALLAAHDSTNQRRGIRFLDISNPYNTKAIGYLPFENLGNTRKFRVSENEGINGEIYLYMCTSTSLQIYDITKPYEILLMYEIPAPIHNITISRCYDVYIDEERHVIFISFSYDNSIPGDLVIYNVTDKSKPEHISTTEYSNGYKYGLDYYDNKVYISAGNLFIFDVRNLTGPILEADINVASTARFSQIYNNKSIILASRSFMEIINLEDTSISTWTEAASYAEMVEVNGDYAFFSIEGTGGGLKIYDISNISTSSLYPPTKIYEDTAGNIHSSATLGNYVYLPEEQRDVFEILVFGDLNIAGTPTSCGDFTVTVSGTDGSKNQYGERIMVNTSFDIQVRKVGYFDEQCSVYICPSGLYSNSSSSLLCSGHGTCDIPNHCICDTGYFGTKCESWICGNVDATNFGVVCSSHGTCVDYDRCICDSSNEEIFEYTGKFCEIKVGRQFVRSTKTVLMSYFEISTENLKDNYGLEVDVPFDCSIFFNLPNSDIPFRNCTLSNRVEFFSFPGSTQFIKIFVDHISEDSYFDILKDISSSSISLKIYNKTFSTSIYPSYDLLKKNEKFTMKSFSQGDISEHDTSLPLVETQFCKMKLFLDDQCIQYFECYPSLFEDQVFSYFSVGFTPSSEGDYYRYTKFYFSDLQTCEKGTNFDKFTSFSAVSCYGSVLGDNFLMYTKCSNNIMDIFFDSAVLNILLVSSSPMYVLIILFTCLFFCCVLNLSLYCIRRCLICIGCWKFCPLYKEKHTKKRRIGEKEIKGETDEEETDKDSITEKEEEDDDEDSSYFGEETSDSEYGYKKYTSISTPTTTSNNSTPRSNNNNNNRRNHHQQQQENQDEDDDFELEDLDEQQQQQQHIRPKKIRRNRDELIVTSFSNSQVRLINQHQMKEKENNKKNRKEKQQQPSSSFVFSENEDDENEVYSSSSSSSSSTSNSNSSKSSTATKDDDDDEKADDELIFVTKQQQQQSKKRKKLLSRNNMKVSPSQRELLERWNQEDFDTEETTQQQLTNNNNNGKDSLIRSSTSGTLIDIFNDIVVEYKNSYSEVMENKKLSSLEKVESLDSLSFVSQETINKLELLHESKIIKELEDKENKKKKKKKESLIYHGKVSSLRGKNCGSCLLCYCCFGGFCCCGFSVDILKCLLMIFFILIKDGLALWFSSSEFLSNADVDVANKDYIILTTVLNMAQFIIWISIFLMFSVAYGSLKEYIWFRLLKSSFLLWFICINLFCYITKFAYLDSFEKQKMLISPTFYLSIVLPEGLLVFKLVEVLAYNGVSSQSMYKRMKKLGVYGFYRFPKVSISIIKCGLDCDVILEDFFQCLFLLDVNPNVQSKETFVKELERSEEYGHLTWSYVRGLKFEELKYLRKFFFPNDIGNETYMSVFQYHRIISAKWLFTLVLFPFVCCVGSSLL